MGDDEDAATAMGRGPAGSHHHDHRPAREDPRPCAHVEERIAALKGGAGGDVLVAGSPTLVRRLISWGLLDEPTVLLIPIVVGHGGRFFPEQDDVDGLARRPLHLEACHRYASGVVQLRYRPAG